MKFFEVEIFQSKFFKVEFFLKMKFFKVEFFLKMKFQIHRTHKNFEVASMEPYTK